MDEPLTVPGYLVVFNEALVVRLGRRRRILAEVEDHLRTAAAAAMANGCDHRQAETVAITAFGAPDEVAKTFRSDIVGIVDRRLTHIASVLDRLQTSRPLLGSLVRAWPPYAAVVASLFLLGLTGVASGPDVTLLAALQLGAWPWFALNQSRALRKGAPHRGDLDERRGDSVFEALRCLPIGVLVVSLERDGKITSLVLFSFFWLTLSVGMWSRLRARDAETSWVPLAAGLMCILAVPAFLALRPSDHFDGRSQALLVSMLLVLVASGQCWARGRAQAESLRARLAGRH